MVFQHFCPQIFIIFFRQTVQQLFAIRVIILFQKSCQLLCILSRNAHPLFLLRMHCNRVPGQLIEAFFPQLHCICQPLRAARHFFLTQYTFPDNDFFRSAELRQMPFAGRNARKRIFHSRFRILQHKRNSAIRICRPDAVLCQITITLHKLSL